MRGLYKAGEKRKQDLEEEKREMARVEQVFVSLSYIYYQDLLTFSTQAAQAAFARDVGAGLVKPGSSSTSAPSKPAPPRQAPKASSNPYDNYSTASSLGYTDPDLERANAEAERRKTQGVAGEWQVVATEEPAPQGDDVPQNLGEQPAPVATPEPAAQAVPAPPKKGRGKKIVFGVIALAALAGGTWFGHDYWTTGRFTVSTDDAYVGADLTILSPKVGGYVESVDVVANLAVMTSGILVLFTGIRYLDLIVGAGIGLYVIREAIEIISDARRATPVQA